MEAVGSWKALEKHLPIDARTQENGEGVTCHSCICMASPMSPVKGHIATSF